MLRNINKKLIIAGLAAALLFSFYLYTSFRQSELIFLYQMSGRIKEVKDGSIVVSGIVEHFDPQDKRQGDARTIEFAITPQTVFKTSVTVITSAQIKGGQPFHPETKERPGKVFDLVSGMRIVSIQSKEDLFVAEKATASEVNYASYDLPTQ